MLSCLLLNLLSSPATYLPTYPSTNHPPVAVRALPSHHLSTHPPTTNRFRAYYPTSPPPATSLPIHQPPTCGPPLPSHLPPYPSSTHPPVAVRRRQWGSTSHAPRSGRVGGCYPAASATGRRSRARAPPAPPLSSHRQTGMGQSLTTQWEHISRQHTHTLLASTSLHVSLKPSSPIHSSLFFGDKG